MPSSLVQEVHRQLIPKYRKGVHKVSEHDKCPLNSLSQSPFSWLCAGLAHINGLAFERDNVRNYDK